MSTQVWLVRARSHAKKSIFLASWTDIRVRFERLLFTWFKRLKHKCYLFILFLYLTHFTSDLIKSSETGKRNVLLSVPASHLLTIGPEPETCGRVHGADALYC